MDEHCETEVARSETEAITLVKLRGELTLATAGGVRDHIDAELPGSGDVILDLSGITFLDSSGIQLVFLLTKVVATAGGTLRLVVDGRTPVGRVLRLVDPAGAIPSHGSALDALEASRAANASRAG